MKEHPRPPRVRIDVQDEEITLTWRNTEFIFREETLEITEWKGDTLLDEITEITLWERLRKLRKKNQDELSQKTLSKEQAIQNSQKEE